MGGGHPIWPSGSGSQIGEPEKVKDHHRTPLLRRRRETAPRQITHLISDSDRTCKRRISMGGVIADSLFDIPTSLNAPHKGEAFNWLPLATLCRKQPHLYIQERNKRETLGRGEEGKVGRRKIGINCSGGGLMLAALCIISHIPLLASIGD